MITTDETIKTGVLSHRENSDTAASVGNRLFPDGGSQLYRVLIRGGMGGMMPVDVEATSGDQAAELALAKVPGGFVANVAPAPKAN